VDDDEAGSLLEVLLSVDEASLDPLLESPSPFFDESVFLA
jgi:hypothetical protein